jgi:hypothetical protein
MVSSALNEMLRADAPSLTTSPVEISYVVGSRRPAYHVLVSGSHTASASVVLERVLERPFPASYSGWFIDGSEARALIEAAHRIAKSRTE